MLIRNSCAAIRVLALAVWLCMESTMLAEFQVGLAQADITPPVGGLTTGYSSAQPTTGIHDSVSARVMVMQNESVCVAMVVCDLCIYNSPQLHSQMKSIGVDHLLLMNTHTHAGPKMNQDGFPTIEKPWRETVDERLLAAIKEAKQNLFTAYVTASASQIQLGYNRLVQRGEYAVTHFENPARIPYGEVDRQVGVLRISDQHKKVRAVIVNYACHPVVLGPRNRQISADYPGVTRNIIESDIGDGCMCLFVQSGGGDINPLIMARGEARERDFDDVQKLGELLAVEVKRALVFAKDDSGQSSSFAVASSQLSFRSRWDSAESLTLGVTTLLINNSIAIMTMPGEPFHFFPVDFRKKSGLKHAFFFGYCCDGPYDWPSYLPDLQSAARGGYGASDTTRAEVGAGERLVNQGVVQLYELQGRLKSAPQRHTYDKEPN